MNTMALAEKDLEIVTEHIQKAFPVLLQLSPSDVTALRNNHASERSMREEERSEQGKILKTIMEQMDKRFAEAREERREQGEILQTVMEQTNQRIAEGREDTNRRFEETNQRIAEGREDTNRRIAKVSEDMNKRFQYTQWMIGIGFTVITLVIRYL